MANPNFFSKGTIGVTPQFTDDRKGMWLRDPHGESVFIHHDGKGPIRDAYWKGDTLVVKYDKSDMHMVGCQKGFEDYNKTGTPHDNNGYARALEEARQRREREEEINNPKAKSKDEKVSKKSGKKSSIPVKILKGLWWCVKKFFMLFLFFAISDATEKK